MAYSSPSFISSSQWFGPSSCPIISSLSWQTQVLDNLCVLALHNHAASAGEGASNLSSCVISFTGQKEYISPFFPSGSTNWQPVFTQAATWGISGNVSTSTNNASISYDVYWGTGLHTAYFLYGKGSSFGLITACLSGNSPVSPACIDGYVSGVERSASAGSFQFRVYTVEEFSRTCRSFYS